ncbi:MAG TPA: hypothetical protein VJ873_08975, partial [bacterium]|nr:hypothetical protein [bacterium]
CLSFLGVFVVRIVFSFGFCYRFLVSPELKFPNPRFSPQKFLDENFLDLDAGWGTVTRETPRGPFLANQKNRFQIQHQFQSKTKL